MKNIIIVGKPDISLANSLRYGGINVFFVDNESEVPEDALNIDQIINDKYVLEKINYLESEYYEEKPKKKSDPKTYGMSLQKKRCFS